MCWVLHHYRVQHVISVVMENKWHHCVIFAFVNPDTCLKVEQVSFLAVAKQQVFSICVESTRLKVLIGISYGFV